MTGHDNDTVSSVLKVAIVGSAGGVGGESGRGRSKGPGGTLHGDKGQFKGGCWKRGGGGGDGKTAEWLLRLIWTPRGTAALQIIRPPMFT